MALGLGAGLAAAGGLGSLFGGLSQQKASKELLRRQGQFANQQLQTYGQVNPLYLQAIQQYAGQLGIGGSPGVSQVGANHFQLGPSQDRGQFGLGGGYGSYQDQLRLRAAEEDINRNTMQNANQLRHTLGQRGIAPEIAGAALARNQAAGDQQFGQFRRGLALNAGQERERRLQQLMSMLAPGLGAGGQGAGILGQQGQMAGQQAAQSFAGLGNILGNYAYQQQVPGGGGYGSVGGDELARLGQLSAGGGQTILDPATGRYVLGGAYPGADSYGSGSLTPQDNGLQPIYDPVSGRVVGYR
jgi:hypothetical protein